MNISIEERNKLLIKHQPLIWAVARSITKGKNSLHAIQIEDLVGEGIFGLMRAIERFEASRTKCFSTFAYKCIKSEMSRAIGEQAYPVNIHKNLFRVACKLIKGGKHPKMYQVHYSEAIKIITGGTKKLNDFIAIKKHDPLSAEYIYRLVQTQLNGRERDIVSSHFFGGITYPQLGLRYGVTKQAIHQAIYKKALPKLKKIINQSIWI